MVHGGGKGRRNSKQQWGGQQSTVLNGGGGDVGHGGDQQHWDRGDAATIGERRSSKHQWDRDDAVTIGGSGNWWFNDGKWE